MCGIFGYTGDSNTPVDMTKLAHLGRKNDARGGHGCGLFIDNQLIKSVEPPKFTDFFKKYRIAAPKKYNTLLGHCRKATVGAHNEDNTHPFTIRGGTNNRPILTGMHNGTVSNWEELCKERGIDTSDIQVDSVGLLSALAASKRGDFSVLEEYKGAAALAWVYTNRPNELYLYHGKSKRYNNSHQATEERPLYFWDTSKMVVDGEDEPVDSGLRGIYFSSIEESLHEIGALDGEVEELPFNEVFVIKDGVMHSVGVVDREETFQDTWTSTNNYSTGPNYTNAYSGGSSAGNSYPRSVASSYTNVNQVPSPTLFMQSSSFAVDLQRKLFDDVEKVEDNFNKVYFSRGLYWRGKFPAHSRIAAFDFNKSSTEPVMVDVPFFVKTDGTCVSRKRAKEEGSLECYFYKGYLCVNKERYEALVEKCEKSTSTRLGRSDYAPYVHPNQFIAYCDDRGQMMNNSKYLQNDVAKAISMGRYTDYAEGWFHPLFSEKAYRFDKGDLVEIVHTESYNHTVIPVAEPDQEEEDYRADLVTLATSIEETITDFGGDYPATVEDAKDHNILRLILIHQIAKEIKNSD